MAAGRHRRGARATRAPASAVRGRSSAVARLRAIAAFGLLALALVLAQRAAALHWLSHAVAATHGPGVSDANAKAHAPAEPAVAADHCDDCALFAAFAAGAATSLLTVPATDVAARRPPSFGSTAEARAPPLAFRSRAPPIPC